MSNAEIGLAGIGLMLVLLGLRVPIAISLFGVSFGGIYVLHGWKPAIGSLKIIPFEFAANWELSSVPMFLLMGYLAYHTGITRGLFSAARVWLGKLPGGLAVASIFGASGFAAVTGSSVATAAAMGRIAIPEMVRLGYDPRLASGTPAAAGTIGALIPPSILFILFGVIAQVPISKLFLAGASVGLLTAACYVATVVVWVKARPQIAPTSDETHTMRERLLVLVEVLPVVVLALLVFGGLFAGVFTPTEAGAVGAFLTAVVALVQRELTLQRFWASVVECFTTTSVLMFIAIGANLLARFVALSGADSYIAQAIMAVSSDPLLFLLGVTVLYLILGMFLEPIGAMLITLPILMPAARTLGIDLLWFGVLLAKLLEIGMITPPIGLNVFVIKSVVGNAIALSTIFKGVIYFLIADLLIVAFMIMFPGFVTYLPRLVG